MNAAFETIGLEVPSEKAFNYLAERAGDHGIGARLPEGFLEPEFAQRVVLRGSERGGFPLSNVLGTGAQPANGGLVRQHK